MKTEPLWLRIARDDLGQAETTGPNDSPRIRKMLGRLGLTWLAGQPWCGIAVADWMSTADIEPAKNSFRAKAWLDWGIPLDAPTVGAVVVFERKGGGHVGLVVGRDEKGRLLVLGGNQGDKVCISPFDMTRVLGYRWPMKFLSSHVSDMPTYASNAASSTNEA